MESFQILIGKKILQYEPIILVAIAFSILLKNFQLPYSDTVIVFTFGIVGVLYYFTQFAFIQNEKANGFDNFFNKLAAISSAVLVIGVLFKLLHWPGAGPMLIAGLPALAISLIYLVFNMKKIENGTFSKWMLIRLNLLLLLGLAHGYQLFM